jgi:hypothetical protein
MATQTRPPTSDFSASGTWSGTSGSRYTLVNDFPSTNTGSQLTHGTTAGNILFGFSAFTVPAGSTITAVRLKYYDREASSGTNNIGGRLRVGGSTYDVSTHNPTTTTTLRTDTWTTNPRTSSAWTVDDVNGIGSNGLTQFGLRSTDASPTISITSMELEVEYEEPLSDTSAMFLLF